MVNRHPNHGDYYLVNGYDMDEVGFDELPKRSCSRRCKIILTTIILGLILLLFLFVFVVLPLVFMNSIDLQRTLIFTRFDLPNKEEYFTTYKFPSYQNRYLKVKDIDSSNNVYLGVWHILPETLAYQALHDPEFDYDNALNNSKYDILIYFHGTGEARSYNDRKYQFFTRFFHVITFDYRSYADSSKAVLSEDAVVSDCIQLYQWVKNRTNSPIYVWGHSLGAAIAVHTVAKLASDAEFPQALIVESGFTSLRDELYVHPWGKLFAWLPWFKATILDPLHKNGFVFDSASNIRQVLSPVMILHSQDDSIVPVEFGRELYKIASERKTGIENATVYHEFDKELEYNHFSLCLDPFMKYYLMDFFLLIQNDHTNID